MDDMSSSPSYASAVHTSKRRRWGPLCVFVILVGIAVIVGVSVSLARRGEGEEGASEEKSKKKEAEEAEGGAPDPFDALVAADVPKEFNSRDKPATEASGLMRGANRAIAGDKIKREERFYGIAYSPFGLGDNRLCPPFDDIGGQCLMSDQVYADVKLLSTITNRIRLYSMLCVEAVDAILDYCVEVGMEVSLGVWVDDNAAMNKAELGRLEVVLKKYGKKGIITDVVVGNEALFIEGVKVTDLADMMKRVHAMLDDAGSDALVGTTEIHNVWKGKETANVVGVGIAIEAGIDLTPIIEQSDWIGLNSHSYYGDVFPSSGGAGEYVRNEWADIESIYNKPVVIAETGFPSAGDARETDSGTVTPNLNELEQFASQVEAESRKSGIRVFYFEGFNSDWKRRWLKFTEADYSFGLFNCDRSMKNITLPPVGAL